MARPSQPVRLAAWGVGALVLALVRNRLWASPNLAFFTTISTSLGSNPFAKAPGGLAGDYLLTNLLGPTAARVLGQTEPQQYVRLHLLVLIVGLALAVVAAYRRFGYAPARALCVVLAVAPVTTVAMQWLGQPDAFTLPLALGLVIARRWWSVGALGVLLGLSHAEQGVAIALIGALVAVVVDDDVTLDTPAIAAKEWGRRLAPMLGGVVLGRLVVEAYLRLNDIVVTTPRTSFFDLGFSGFAEHHLKSHGVVLYAAWGLLWAVIIAAAIVVGRGGDAQPADPGRTSLRRQWAVLGVGALVAIVPLLVTLDETRVYGLVTAPLLVGGAVVITRTVWPAWMSATRTLAGAAAVALLVPGLFTAGETYGAWNLPPNEFARFLVHGEHPGDLTGWLLGPFGFDVPTAD